MSIVTFLDYRVLMKLILSLQNKYWTPLKSNKNAARIIERNTQDSL